MSRVKTTATTVSYIRSRQQNYAQILSWGFCCFCFRDLIFCLFWMRKHQKLHKRAARPKTYDSRGRHLSDYNNSSNNRSNISSGSEAMKQSAQLNWGPRHSSRPMKMAKKEPAKPGKNQNYFFAQRCGKLKKRPPNSSLMELRVRERVRESEQDSEQEQLSSSTGSGNQEATRWLLITGLHQKSY